MAEEELRWMGAAQGDEKHLKALQRVVQGQRVTRARKISTALPGVCPVASVTDKPGSIRAYRLEKKAAWEKKKAELEREREARESTA